LVLLSQADEEKSPIPTPPILSITLKALVVPESIFYHFHPNTTIMGKSHNTLVLAARMMGKAGVWGWHSPKAFSSEDAPQQAAGFFTAQF
jgi:hypothetical protein